jgi:hypothetical protein
VRIRREPMGLTESAHGILFPDVGGATTDAISRRHDISDFGEEGRKVRNAAGAVGTFILDKACH